MNRELLARVRELDVEIVNDRSDMAQWAQGEVREGGQPDCGTTACIGGWAFAIAHGSFNLDTSNLDWFSKTAADLLDLPWSEATMCALFYSTLWPAHYRSLAEAEGDAKGMLSLLDAILDGRVVFDDDGSLVDLEAQLADEVEEMALGGAE